MQSRGCRDMAASQAVQEDVCLDRLGCEGSCLYDDGIGVGL